MSELEKSSYRTLVLVVRIYLGTRRWMSCLPISCEKAGAVGVLLYELEVAD